MNKTLCLRYHQGLMFMHGSSWYNDTFREAEEYLSYHGIESFLNFS